MSTQVSVLLALGAFASLAGCAGNCGSPRQLDGQLFRVFANEVERINAPGFDEFTAAPEFLSYASPANGPSDWSFEWGNTALGPITVAIDGQPFEGQGLFDEVECGQIELEFSGTYTSVDAGTTHGFATVGNLVASGDRLRGELEWRELWSTEDGRSGTYHAIIHIQGQK